MTPWRLELEIGDSILENYDCDGTCRNQLYYASYFLCFSPDVEDSGDLLHSPCLTSTSAVKQSSRNIYLRTETVSLESENKNKNRNRLH